jgi:hypothetical protein
MGLINLGAGLSALGSSVAQTAGEIAMSQQKAEMETQKLLLADQLKSSSDRFTQGQENLRNQSRIDAEDRRAAAPEYGEKGVGVNPATNKSEVYQLDKKSGAKSWTGIAPDPEIQFVNGQAVDKRTVTPGTIIADPHLPIQQQQADASTQRAHSEAQRVTQEGARVQQENFSSPTMIGYTGPDGEEVQKAAIYDKKKGQYFDVETLQPIQSPKGLRVIGTSTTSARSQAAISRILTNAEDATSGIENLSNISSSASGGLYKNLETTPLSSLKRLVTPQEVQDVQATIAGLSRAMGGLATGGLAVDENVMKSYEGLNLNTGDSYITKMRKLAEMRQQSTNALDVQSVSPILSNDQRKKAAALSDRIKVAIPWTVSDVQKLENSDNPKASLRDVSMKKLGVTSDVHIGQAPTGVDPALWQHMTPQEQALWQK